MPAPNCVFTFTCSIITQLNQIRFGAIHGCKQPNLQKCRTVLSGLSEAEILIRNWSLWVEIIQHTHTHTHTHTEARDSSETLQKSTSYYEQKDVQKVQNYKLDFTRYCEMCIPVPVWSGAKILIGTSLKWIEPTEDKLLNLAIKAMWFTVNSTRLTVPQLRA